MLTLVYNYCNTVTISEEFYICLKKYISAFYNIEKQNCNIELYKNVWQSILESKIYTPQFKFQIQNWKLKRLKTEPILFLNTHIMVRSKTVLSLLLDLIPVFSWGLNQNQFFLRVGFGGFVTDGFRSGIILKVGSEPGQSKPGSIILLNTDPPRRPAVHDINYLEKVCILHPLIRIRFLHVRRIRARIKIFMGVVRGFFRGAARSKH